MKYYFIPIRTAIKQTKKYQKITSVGLGCGEIGMLVHRWWECKMALENNALIPQKKLNRELPYDPTIPLLNITPRSTERLEHIFL